MTRVTAVTARLCREPHSQPKRVQARTFSRQFCLVSRFFILATFRILESRTRRSVKKSATAPSLPFVNLFHKSLGALPHLRKLGLDRCPLLPALNLDTFPALQELHLAHYHVQVDRDGALPSTLTRLRLENVTVTASQLGNDVKP